MSWELENNKKINIFRRRMRNKIIILFWFVALFVMSSIISKFEDITVFLKIPKGFAWLFINFIPKQNTMVYLPKILKTAFETVLLSITATVISSIFALIMAIFGSEVIGISGLKIIAKVIASIFRNMPLVSWSIILLFSFKQSEMTGLLALVLITFGYLTRTFMETIDEVAGDVLEALKSTGANYFQIIFQGVIPSVSSQLISWILYFIENSIREVTLIGVLTGTGLGFVFSMYYRSFKYDVAGLVILVVIILVISIELFSNKIRKALL